MLLSEVSSCCLFILLPEYQHGYGDPQNDHNHQTTEEFQALNHGSRILLNATSDI